MLTVYVPGPAGLVSFAPVPGEAVPTQAVWIDLLNPQLPEIQRVEEACGIEIPTREEMQEIEVSSRLYQEEGALYLTATVLSQSESNNPETTAVTFILAGEHLVTVRHAEPKPFRAFALRAQRQASLRRGEQVLTGLLEAVVDRAADILERVTGEVDDLSREVFKHSGAAEENIRDFQEILRSVGQTGGLCSRARESLMSIGRLLAFLSQGVSTKGAGKDLRNQLKIMWRDVQSLLDHANFLAGKITFLLDATLGMINIEQNAIIKIFSVVAVIFLPPTLVASIYGMNFEIMPELSWPFGYPLALVMMLVSAFLPYIYFKRKGWL
jgi:magnesium transporter